MPQVCVSSPLLYLLYTHECAPYFPTNSVIKFVDDTTIVGQMKGGDLKYYRKEFGRMAQWCEDNNLFLNTIKTKEVILL